MKRTILALLLSATLFSCSEQQDLRENLTSIQENGFAAQLYPCTKRMEAVAKEDDGVHYLIAATQDTLTLDIVTDEGTIAQVYQRLEECRRSPYCTAGEIAGIASSLESMGLPAIRHLIETNSLKMDGWRAIYRTDSATFVCLMESGTTFKF